MTGNFIQPHHITCPPSSPRRAKPTLDGRDGRVADRCRARGRQHLPPAAYAAGTDGAQIAEAAVRNRRRARPAGPVHAHSSVLGRGLLLAMIEIPDFSTPAAQHRKLGREDCKRSTGQIWISSRKIRPLRTTPRATACAGCPDVPAGPSSEGARPCLNFCFCSLVTILPDYLYRRYVQGKRIGKDITFFSVWFELRWGITACLMLTVVADHRDLLLSSLDHQRDGFLPHRSDRHRRRSAASPRSTSASARQVSEGTLLFRLDSSKQQAAVETAQAQDRGGRRRAGRRRRPTLPRPRVRSRKRRAPISRRSTNSRSSASCSGAIPASSRSATSRSCR